MENLVNLKLCLGSALCSSDNCQTSPRINSLYHRLKKYFYYIRTVVSQSERTELALFRKIQVLSKKTTLTDGENIILVGNILKISGSFNDSLIKRHFKRMNNHHSDSGYKPYEHAQSEEKKQCIRVQALYEILALKWDFGRGIDDLIGNTVSKAHSEAVKIENLYMAVLTKDKSEMSLRS